MIPGGVRNSNAYTVPALATRAGAEVTSVERVADEPAGDPGGAPAGARAQTSW